jgi:hypothetical protein
MVDKISNRVISMPVCIGEADKIGESIIAKKAVEVTLSNTIRGVYAVSRQFSFIQ